MKTLLDRRSFLRTTAFGAGGLAFLGPFGRTALAQSQPATSRRFVFAYFGGGWDLLLGLDPRDPATTRPDVHRIDPAYGSLGAPYVQRGVQRAGNLSFGPAVPPALLAHANKLCVVNGIGMDTASHEVGRRYFITGRFPRGITAVGSSTPSEIIAQIGDQSPIPHLSAAVEAYATGLPSYASPLSVNGVNDLIGALTPFADIQPDVLAAVQDYQDAPFSCGATSLDRDGLATEVKTNLARARGYIEAQLGQVFDTTRTDSEIAQLRTLYGLRPSGDAPDSPEVLAFVAGQALKAGVSQAVSVRLASTLDTHSNWAADHPPALQRGFQALAALLTDLEESEDPTAPGRRLLDDTTVLAFSEFGRTPELNSLQGRDHFLGNSCLLAGAGIRGDQTVGASASVGMMPVFLHRETGQPVIEPEDSDLESGAVITISPKHVLATVLASAGLDASYLRTPPLPTVLRD